MIEVWINGRAYRTDNARSPVSGRLMIVQSLRDNGLWKSVKNVSRREDVLRLVEAGNVGMLSGCCGPL